jgi:hypothetical protein
MRSSSNADRSIVSGGAYARGMVATLAFVVAVGYSAFRLRRWLLPGWSGSPARLVEVVLGLSIVICLSELLGLFGLFDETPLLVGATALALGCHRLPPRARLARDGDIPKQPSPFPTASVAVGVAVVLTTGLAIDWLPYTIEPLDHGILGVDALWYELPNAAWFAQTGSLTGLHFNTPLDLLQWFLPANSELVHSVGMVLVGRDLFSPVMNLGWLGLAVLAAWCVGRPYGAGALSTIAVAPVLASPQLVASQSGAAKPDIATLALMLASVAILVNGARTDVGRGRDGFPASPAAVAVAGLAAGLAVGARLNQIPLVAVAGLGLILIAGAGRRARVGLAWFGPVLATSAFWYLRNLFTVGNPLPWIGVHLGPVSVPATESVVKNYPQPHTSLADVITNGSDWSNYFLPNLKASYGDLWFLLLGMALLGMIACVVERGAAVRRVLGAAALVGVVAYAFTPYTGSGVNGNPTQFIETLRYLTPTLALGLALLPTLSFVRSDVRRYAVAAVMISTFLFAFDFEHLFTSEVGDTAILVGAAIGLVLTAAILLARRPTRIKLVGYGAIAILAAAVLWPVARDYLRNRYSEFRPFAWASGVHDARIGIDGTVAGFAQYAYYGRDLSNTVDYIARRGPRGSFDPIETCAAWRTAVNRGHYDYLVLSQTHDPGDFGNPAFAPEPGWLHGDPAATLILRDGPVSVFNLDGPLDPNGCARPNASFSGLPPLLR